ncbi:hypothetical protein FKW77_010818 [Venturia effusa]|uniref:Uncharacterized protein n=1 Tax=Venturia effusa TaxID=50376 RepID=A0A517KYK5_9PEZI|nr:hypothetical protein FKW77_010818 [Venturia effusa]
MANPPPSDATALAKHLTETFTPRTQGDETRFAVESLKAAHDQTTSQQATMKEQIDNRLDDVFEQLSAIQAMQEQIGKMKEHIAVLSREKEELTATVSTIHDNFRSLQLQVAAQDGLRVYHTDFLDSAAASPKVSTQPTDRFEDEDHAMLIDPESAIESKESPADHDMSMTITNVQLPDSSSRAPFFQATPERAMPPPSFVTPMKLTGYRAATPGSGNTMMPDTAGFNKYGGPFHMAPGSFLAASSEAHDENLAQRPKRARRHSAVPLEDLALQLSPITEGTTQLAEPMPVTDVDKTLWRETWQLKGKPGTLEEFARKKKSAMLSSDVNVDKERPRKRYTASDFEKLPAPEEKKRKRVPRQQPSAVNSMPPPSFTHTRRPFRASRIPGYLRGKDFLGGKGFHAATKSRNAIPPGQAPEDTPPKKDSHANGDEDDEEDDEEAPQTPGKAASSLLQQFGVRKTKASKKAAK